MKNLHRTCLAVDLVSKSFLRVQRLSFSAEVESVKVGPTALPKLITLASTELVGLGRTKLQPVQPQKIRPSELGTSVGEGGWPCPDTGMAITLDLLW